MTSQAKSETAHLLLTCTRCHTHMFGLCEAITRGMRSVRQSFIAISSATMGSCSTILSFNRSRGFTNSLCDTNALDNPL